MLIPSDDSRCQIDIDLLYLLILLHAMDTKLPADTTHLIAAPRCLIEGWIVAVDPCDSVTDLIDHTVGSGNI